MPKIYGVSRAEFIRVSEDVFARFLAHSKISKNERRGAYIGLYDKRAKKVLMIVELGDCLPDRARFWFYMVIEKQERLFENEVKGHISSYQSRDEGLRRYGGAITAPPDSKGTEAGRMMIGSVSGMHDHSEESIILVIWMAFGWLTL